jgi:5-methylcytosine-specific restriction enzyme B
MPDKSVLGSAVVEGIPLGPWLQALNQRIREHIGRDARNLQIGHAYLLDNGRPVGDFVRLARAAGANETRGGKSSMVISLS